MPRSLRGRLNLLFLVATIPPLVRIRALSVAGSLAHDQGDFLAARPLHDDRAGWNGRPPVTATFPPNTKVPYPSGGAAYDVDFSRVDALRRKYKAKYEAAGTSLTFTAFIADDSIVAK